MTFALVRAGRVHANVLGDVDAGIVIEESTFEAA